MERHARRQRHGSVGLFLAVALAAVAAGRGDDARAAGATGRSIATITDRGEVAAASMAGGFLLDDGRFPASTTSAVAVMGTEQTPATSTTRSPTTLPATTLPPATVSTTAFDPTTLVPTALPPPTPTSTTLAPVVAATPQVRGDQALGRIGYDWRGRLPGWSITFSPGRSGVYGYTYVGEQRIEIFVRDTMSDALLAHVIAHELGHAVDVTLNDGDERSSWAASRGIEDVQWWPGNGVTDFATGAGDFAEAFAVWQVGPANYRGTAAGVPSSEQLSNVAALAGS